MDTKDIGNLSRREFLTAAGATTAVAVIAESPILASQNAANNEREEITMDFTKLSDRIQEADWKKEKHAPVIECPDRVKSGEIFEVKVGLGKEIAHPNTTEHHISWITLYFHPEGKPFSHQVGHFEFSAHGESTAGPNEGPVYTHHQVTTSLKIDKPGTLHALALCNIHGLWESSKEVDVC